MSERFPRTLYKKGGPLLWGGNVEYSAEVVQDEKEFNLAIKNGFADDFQVIVSKDKPKPKVKKVIAPVVEEKTEGIDEF